jgi:D-glycero-D-manno-heptose 1,7-bisphosphate phosphatase
VGVRTLGGSRRAVFFDRDGVLNEAIVRDGKPYPPNSIADLRLVPGARRALERLANVVPLLFVVTNQPDVARGTQKRETVETMHEELKRWLPIERIYACYHDDADGCACRKPKPGSLLAAATEFGLDLRMCYMIGDRWRDIDAGAAAGCTTILLDRGYDERSPAQQPDVVVRTLEEAVDEILRAPKTATISTSE